METSNTAMTTEVKGNEVIFTKLLNAHRELVFEVWTDIRHVSQWWGPNGFTTTTQEHEVKPGGTWRFMMHGPDGRDYPNKIVFMEVVKPERLVYRHTGDEDTQPDSFYTTVTFVAKGNQTLLTMHTVFSSAAELERLSKEYGAIEGGQQTLSRMTAHLESLQK